MNNFFVEHIATVNSACLLYIMEYLDDVKHWFDMRTRRCGKGIHEVRIVTEVGNSKAFDNVQFLAYLKFDVEWERSVRYERLPKV